MLVEDIEQSVGEPPEEEENGDENNGPDRLLGGDLGSTGDGLVANMFIAFMFHGIGSRGTTFLVLVDLFETWARHDDSCC